MPEPVLEVTSASAGYGDIRAVWDVSFALEGMPRDATLFSLGGRSDDDGNAPLVDPLRGTAGVGVVVVRRAVDLLLAGHAKVLHRGILHGGRTRRGDRATATPPVR